MLNFPQVSTNGFVNLVENNSSPSVASVYAFLADVDTRSVGQVLYREINMSNPSLLSDIGGIVRRLYSSFGDFSPTYVFVTTWFYVGYFDNHDDRVSNRVMCCC